jgi:hypothetical protein
VVEPEFLVVGVWVGVERCQLACYQPEWVGWLVDSGSCVVGEDDGGT